MGDLWLQKGMPHLWMIDSLKPSFLEDFSKKRLYQRGEIAAGVGASGNRFELHRATGEMVVVCQKIHGDLSIKMVVDSESVSHEWNMH